MQDSDIILNADSTPSSTQSRHASVSAIVPIYNGAADLPELLDCLSAQTYPRDRVEYLIVDNNSRDNTAELLDAAQRDSKLPLRPLREAEIQSSYAARNRGIRAARYDLLAFTDADCRPEPTWLERLVQPFHNPEVGLVAGEIEALAPQTLLERYAERQKTLSQTYTLEHPFCPYGQTANLAVRRAALATVGLFRPYLTTGGDADLCWRILRETDWQLKFAQTAIVRHRHRATLDELRKQWQRYGESNRYLHELHGVALQQPASPTRSALRWLLKSLPRDLAKWAIGRGSVVDVLSPPIAIYTSQARKAGQDAAKLPEAARDIARLDESSEATG